MTTRFRLRAAVVLAVLAFGATGAPLLAQDKPTKEEKRLQATQRSVQGVVTSPDDQPVSEAIVQLKDLKTLQVRSYITKPDGSYHFYALSNNIDYELKAESKGLTSAKKPLSVYDSRKVAIINLKLEKK